MSFLTSMGGISGAFLLLPFQVTVLGFDTPAVSSTNLVYNIVAIPGGIVRFVREGRMVWPLVLTISLGTVPAVFVGAILRVRYLPDPAAFKLLVGVVLLYIGGRMAYDLVRTRRGDDAPGQRDVRMARRMTGGAGRRGGAAPAAVRVESFGPLRCRCRYADEAFDFNPLAVLLLVCVTGVVGGAYGIGGGAIIAPILVSVFALPVYTVAGATLTGTFLTSIVGVTTYTWVAPHVSGAEVAASPDWLLGAVMGAGGLVGIYLGARLQKHVPARAIKWMLAAIMLFVAARYVVLFFSR
jgi:hypothetical protein